MLVAVRATWLLRLRPAAALLKGQCDGFLLTAFALWLKFTRGSGAAPDTARLPEEEVVTGSSSEGYAQTATKVNNVD